MSIGRVGQRRQVVIPKEICEASGLKEGAFVEITQRGGTIVIKPKTLVDPEDVLTPQEEKAIERGFQQLKRGQHVSWKQLKRDLGV